MARLAVCVVGSALLFARATASQIVFEPQLSTGSQGGSFSPRIDLGDVDGDGDRDVVISTDTDSLFHDYEVLLNDGSGALSIVDAVSVSPGIRALVLERFDADVHLDLITGQGSSVYLRRGVGDGTFGVAELIKSWASPSIAQIEAADVTGDGLLDLVVLRGAEVTLLPGLGTGGLGAAVTVGSVGTLSPYAARAVDLNGDQMTDLLVTARDLSLPGQATSLVHVFLKAGGAYNLWSTYPMADFAAVELLTLEGDAVPDMVCASASGVETWAGLGNGGFQQEAVLETGTFDTGVAVADFDGDGFADVAGVADDSGEIVFWRQDEAGDFHESLRLSHADAESLNGQSPLSVRPLQPVDMNGDGKPDLVRSAVDDFSQVHVSVYRNHTYGPGDPFLDLGYALSDPGWAGGSGDIPGAYLATPILLADGTMEAGTIVRLRVLRHGVEPTAGFLVLGADALMKPAFGGTFVPTPHILVGPLVMPSFDSFVEIATVMPTGIPAGSQFWMQAWFPPADAFQDYSATSGVRATAP